VLDYLAGRMRCKDFVEMVTDYLEGTMSLAKRIRFHFHLGTLAAGSIASTPVRPSERWTACLRNQSLRRSAKSCSSVFVPATHAELSFASSRSPTDTSCDAVALAPLADENFLDCVLTIRIRFCLRSTRVGA
jgi:hypothetical protein